MNENELKKITAMLREKGVTHLFFAGTENSIFTSCNCSPADLYSFLISLIDRLPGFKEIIIEVADRIDSGVMMDNGNDEDLAN